MSRTLTLLVWMWPTTVCGSDIAYSCVWMSSVVRLTTVYHCRELLYLSHTVSCCFVVSPFGCTAAEFVCLSSRVANPCCEGDMLRHGNRLPPAPAEPSHLSQESSQLTTPPSGCACAGVQWHYRCCLITSTLKELPHPSALRTFVPAAYHFITYCITCSSATERSYIV